MGSRVKRVYGIDFSGSQTAGDKIWVASGSVQSDVLFIEECFPGRELPSSSRDRETCLVALRRFIENERNALFGLDFPFGLPEAISNGHADWPSFVSSFSQTYDGPYDLHERCKAVGGEILDSGVEIRRITDEDAKAPFCPYNWRIKHQTYYGIAHLLAPIVENNAARVLPMQSPENNKPWLIEVCPSSTLGEFGLPRSGYKGNGSDHTRTREEIIDGLGERGLAIATGLRDTVVTDSEGDVVDSIVAALTTYRASQDDFFRGSGGVEGHIYV